MDQKKESRMNLYGLSLFVCTRRLLGSKSSQYSSVDGPVSRHLFEDIQVTKIGSASVTVNSIDSGRSGRVTHTQFKERNEIL